jgi:hypothetical protein
LDPHQRLFDNPDGTHSLVVSPGTLTGLDESGAPGELDLGLVTGKDGRLRPHRTRVPVTIAQVSGARMASIEVAPGKTADLDVEGIKRGFTPGLQPDPTGEVARFDGALPQGTGLEMKPLGDGLETTYVVGSAGAATNLLEHLTLPAGFSARQTADAIQVLDDGGTVVGTWRGGDAFDNSAHRVDAAVSMKLIDASGTRVTAQVVVDGAWLADPKRVYPVSIDPTYVREYTNVAGAGATYITTNAPDTGHFGADPLLSGWNDAGAGTNRTFIKYPIDGVPAHSRIVGATMWVYETWSWS